MESQLAIVAEDCRGLEKSDILFLLLHQGEEEVEMSSIELLYQGILPSLPQYMVCTVFFFYVVVFCVKVTTQAEDLKSLMIGFGSH